VSAPARRIFALSKAPHLCPIENRLDAAADSARSFWPRLPKRIKRAHDEAGVDRIDWQEDRRAIGRQRGCPLAAMFGVPPRSLMRLDIGGGAMVKGHGRDRHGGVPRLDRINAVADLGAGLVASNAGLRERYLCDLPAFRLP
jgi:hypothetical protein